MAIYAHYRSKSANLIHFKTYPAMYQLQEDLERYYNEAFLRWLNGGINLLD